MSVEYKKMKTRGAKKYQCKKKYVRRRQRFQDLKSYNSTAKLLRQQYKQDMQFLLGHGNYETYMAPFLTRAVEKCYWDCTPYFFKLFKTRNGV